MKKAYTLAEVLITLGIIGIIAAVIAPAINKSTVDRNKVKYLKSYDALTHTVKNVAANSLIYPALYEYTDTTANKKITYNVANCPFVNDKPGLDKRFINYSGDSKLANILAELLSSKGITRGAVSTQFTTRDGVKWTIDHSSVTWGANGLQWFNYVTIDVNGDEGPNAMYTANSNLSGVPDTFKFGITAAGQVVPLDVYGQMYIDNRKFWQKNKNEAKVVEAGITSDKYQDLTDVLNQEQIPANLGIDIKNDDIPIIPTTVYSNNNGDSNDNDNDNDNGNGSGNGSGDGNEDDNNVTPPQEPIIYYVGTISGYMYLENLMAGDREVRGSRKNISMTFTLSDKMTSKNDCYQKVFETYTFPDIPYGTTDSYELTDDLEAVEVVEQN